MLEAGGIKPTIRGPYLSPIQLVFKSKQHSRRWGKLLPLRGGWGPKGHCQGFRRDLGGLRFRSRRRAPAHRIRAKERRTFALLPDKISFLLLLSLDDFHLRPSPRRRRCSGHQCIPCAAPTRSLGPPECQELLTYYDAATGVPAPLQLILGNAQSVLAIVDGTPTLAILQDLILPEDILAQAIREAGIPAHQLAVEAPGLPRPSTTQDETETSSSNATPSEPSSTPSDDEDADESDSLEDAALRILKWLHVHEPFPPLPEDDNNEEQDSRRPAFLAAGAPHPPVRPSLPPPLVNWERHLATAITREARARGLWCWSHIDNFLFAHSDADFLRLKTDQVVSDLIDCGFRLNPDDSQFVPAQRIRFLGFLLDGKAGTIGHTPGRYKDLLGTLQTLKGPLPISTYQRLAGLCNFYFSVYQGHFHALRPLHQAAVTGIPPPLDWVQIFSFTLAMLPAAVPFVPPAVQHAVFRRQLDWPRQTGGGGGRVRSLASSYARILTLVGEDSALGAPGFSVPAFEDEAEGRPTGAQAGHGQQAAEPVPSTSRDVRPPARPRVRPTAPRATPRMSRQERHDEAAMQAVANQTRQVQQNETRDARDVELQGQLLRSIDTLSHRMEAVAESNQEQARATQAVALELQNTTRVLVEVVLLLTAERSRALRSQDLPSPAQPPLQPSQVQPRPAEHRPAEPRPAEPSPAEPSPAEPSPAEPSPAEPSPAEPSPSSPAEPSTAASSQI
ncbi:hypothetical protein ISCGN_023894 [Ixodes scapularis]